MSMNETSPPTGPKAMAGQNTREGRSPSRQPSAAVKKDNGPRAESVERAGESKSRKANLVWPLCAYCGETKAYVLL